MSRLVPSLIGLIILLLWGCASQSTRVGPAAPLPEDLGWSPVLREESLPPPAIPDERIPGPAEKVLEYVEGDWMRIAIPTTTPVVLALGADEWGKDRSFVQPDAEMKPWTIEFGQSGTARSVLHVVVTEPNLRLRLIVTTTKRIYLIELRSVVKNAVAVVRWDYPPEPVAEAPRLLPDPTTPAVYYTGYTIHAGATAPLWTPRQVVNDVYGKTYIFFPAYLGMIESPMTRLVGPNGPSVMNAKLVGSVLRVDHLITHQLELRLGNSKQAEVVTITRGELTPIQCPGDQACPTWPDRLAGR